MTIRRNGTICVFCGSSDHIGERYHRAAVEMGQAIVASGFAMVYGGGKTGLMGTIANAVLEGGGRVIGVLPEIFKTSVLAHSGLDEYYIVHSLNERKAKMIELADAFLVLPGGFGTFDELFEVITLAQIGLHHHPIGLLNINHYFDPCIRLIEHASQEGFIYTEHGKLMVSAVRPDELLARLAEYQPPKDLDRWVQREEEEE